MKIIALEKEVEGKTAEDFAPHLNAEALKVWEYQKEGFIREIYFRSDQKSAVLVLEAETVDEAKKTLDRLPLVMEKLITFELIPLKAYDGFERLFALKES